MKIHPGHFDKRELVIRFHAKSRSHGRGAIVRIIREMPPGYAWVMDSVKSERREGKSNGLRVSCTVVIIHADSRGVRLTPRQAAALWEGLEDDALSDA